MKSSIAFALACTCMLAACGGAGTSSPPVTKVPLNITFSNAQGVAVNALTFTSVGSSSAQSIIATQFNGTGALSESDTCTTSAGTIAAVKAQSNAGGSATFVVTPVSAGACKITVSGGTDYSATLVVGITITQFPIQ